MNNTRKVLWGAVLFVALGVTSAVAIKTATTSHDEMPAKLGQSFSLMDHNGDRITEADLKGSPVAIMFGFTSCPEVCPTSLYRLSGWINRMGDKSRGLKTYFVTVDPRRDSAPLMKDYVSAFGDRIVGITGTESQIAALAKSWRVYINKIDQGDGDYTIDHSADIFLMGRDGKFAGTIAHQENDENAIQKLSELTAG